jgi:hypothetical protein
MMSSFTANTSALFYEVQIKETTLKSFRTPLLSAPALCLLLLASAAGFNNPARATSDDFSVREYNIFHDLLHPLEHEAVPAKDFQRIRANAADLVRRGEAIVRVGMPKATAERYREDFRKELKKFKSALGKLRKDAKRGTDAQLEASFSAVHDSFEMLAGMLPRK